MLTILTYHQIDQQQWKQLLDTSPTATWFQTDEAYRFYQSVGDVVPFAVGVVEECKVESVKCKGQETSEAVTSALTPYTIHHTLKLVGLIVGYITREKNPLKQFFTRRAIIPGGPLLAEDISETALAELLKGVTRCKVENVKCKGLETSKAVTQASTPYTLHSTPIFIESRNFSDYSKWKNVFTQNGFDYQPHYDIQVACDGEHRMSEQRTRQVKKAIRLGATTREAQTESDVVQWYKILSQLYTTKVRTPLFSKEFFLQLYRQDVAKLLLVEYQGKIIGGMMCPVWRKKALYEWYVCGMDQEYKELYPSVMATYAAIEYAKQNGIALFDFMGAGQPDVPYGVRDFKMEFVGQLVEYGRFRCVRKPLLYKIGKMGVKWLKRKR